MARPLQPRSLRGLVMDRLAQDVGFALRQVRKQHLIHNGATPKMEIDPQTYAVRADGQLLTCEPAKVLPMAQRYFLF